MRLVSHFPLTSTIRIGRNYLKFLRSILLVLDLDFTVETERLTSSTAVLILDGEHVLMTEKTVEA